MKCKICKRKTNWDESYGRDCFIVCPSCHIQISNAIHNARKHNASDRVIALEVILEIGDIKEENKKNNY